MNSTIATAIFIKQFQDIIKNPGVLVQFVIFPLMAFLMTHVVDIGMPGMPASFFITMNAGMFVGMGLIGAAATAIVEDRERNSLRFLLMAGVKSHEYLMGIGGAILALALVVCSVFAVMMPNASAIAMLVMLASLMLGAMASVLIGAITGLISRNEQEAVSISMVAGMLTGFGPMIANISGNDTLLRIFRVFYTMNFVHGDTGTSEALRSFGIILANVTVLAAAFAWVYGRQEAGKKGAIIMSKKVKTAFMAVALVGGASIGFAIWHNSGFIATDNARVTTTLISVSANAPGVLERFEAREGRSVGEGEVIGWVENGEPIRSPIGGRVIRAHAVQNQAVMPMEPLAVIADTSRLHIKANIEETDIMRVRVGQPAIVTIDALGRRRFAGYVSGIGRITVAELAGNPLHFDLSGNFSRTTHLIPVEINIVDDVDLLDLIGVNARVRLPLRASASGPQIASNPSASHPAAPAGRITARGTVESAQRRNVYTTLGHIVEQVFVEVGCRVTAGQILGVLDAEDLTNAADIHILNAEVALGAAVAGLAEAEHNHDAIKTLYNIGAVPRNDLQQSEFRLRSAAAAHRNAQDMLAATRATLGQSVIRAPISGTVTAVFAREGEIGIGRLFTVEDTGNLRIATSFRESDLGRITLGMEVAISSDANGSAAYAGVISRISPAAAAGSQVAEFEAEALVTSENTSLRIGSTARLAVILE